MPGELPASGTEESKMRRYLIPALLGAIVCGRALAQHEAEAPASPAAAPADAADGSRTPKRGWGRGQGGPLKRLMQHLGLTDEQRRTVMGGALRHGPGLVLAGGSLKAAHARISSLLMEATLDRPKVDAEIAALEAGVTKITESAADAILELANVLTPEQRQKLAEVLISRGRGHFGGGREGGHGRMGRMGRMGMGGGSGPGEEEEEAGDNESEDKDRPWHPRRDLTADQRAALHRAHLASRPAQIENRAKMMAGGMRLAGTLLEATPSREAVLGALREIAASCVAREKQRVDNFTQARQIIGEEGFAKLVSSRRPEMVLRMLSGGGHGGGKMRGKHGRRGGGKRFGRQGRGEGAGGAGDGERGGRLGREGRRERFREMRERWEQRRRDRREEDDRDRPRRSAPDRNDRDERDGDRDERDQDRDADDRGEVDDEAEMEGDEPETI